MSSAPEFHPWSPSHFTVILLTVGLPLLLALIVHRTKSRFLERSICFAISGLLLINYVTYLIVAETSESRIGTECYRCNCAIGRWASSSSLFGQAIAAGSRWRIFGESVEHCRRSLHLISVSVFPIFVSSVFLSPTPESLSASFS